MFSYPSQTGLFIVNTICTRWTCVGLSGEKIFTRGHSRFTWHSLHVGKNRFRWSTVLLWRHRWQTSLYCGHRHRLCGRQRNSNFHQTVPGDMSIARTHLHYFCFCHFIIKHSGKKMDRRATWREIVVTWRRCVECRTEEAAACWRSNHGLCYGQTFVVVKFSLGEFAGELHWDVWLKVWMVKQINSTILTRQDKSAYS